METDWNLIWTIIGTGIALATFLYTILRNIKIDMNSEFKETRKEIQTVRSDLTKEIQEVKSELKKEIQEVRTDVTWLKGAFHAKDCCWLKDDQSKKKAE